MASLWVTVHTVLTAHTGHMDHTDHTTPTIRTQAEAAIGMIQIRMIQVRMNQNRRQRLLQQSHRSESVTSLLRALLDSLSTIGQIVKLQVKKGRGMWQTSTDTPATLTNPAQLDETICPIGTLDLSAVTLWTPMKPGRYQLRHVLVSPKGSVAQIHPVVLSVEIR